MNWTTLFCILAFGLIIGVMAWLLAHAQPEPDHWQGCYASIVRSVESGEREQLL